MKERERRAQVVMAESVCRQRLLAVSLRSSGEKSRADAEDDRGQRLESSENGQSLVFGDSPLFFRRMENRGEELCNDAAEERRAVVLARRARSASTKRATVSCVCPHGESSHGLLVRSIIAQRD